MRYQDQGNVAAALHSEQEIDHLFARLAIKITRRLIGENDLGPWRQGAGKRHALLLAAR